MEKGLHDVKAIELFMDLVGKDGVAGFIIDQTNSLDGLTKNNKQLAAAFGESLEFKRYADKLCGILKKIFLHEIDPVFIDSRNMIEDAIVEYEDFVRSICGDEEESKNGKENE